MNSIYVVGLGTSHPCGQSYLREAISLFRSHRTLKVLSESEVALSGGVGTKDPLIFLNSAVCLSTTLSPTSLWLELRLIESRLGRIRTSRNAPRTIDLDLLCWSEGRYHSEEVTLPHPRLHGRIFAVNLARHALEIAGHSRQIIRLTDVQYVVE